ncbi:MAG: hypothetical protein EXR08_00445 [Alphaproteobacteria bacterium]|nr:hypothetical protein [Alphaproteobacteria bacterium]
MENLHLSTKEADILIEMFTLQQIDRRGYALAEIRDHMNTDEGDFAVDVFEQITIREMAFALGKLEQSEPIYSGTRDDNPSVLYQITQAGCAYALLVNEFALVGGKNFETVGVIEGKEADSSSSTELEDVWEPLPLDRQNLALAQAIEKIDELIQAIKQDNGYAANEPDERNFIVSALQAGVQALRDQTVIYRIQFRAFVWEPIQQIATRFGPSAIGVLADAAKEFIKEAFKLVAKKFLDNL